MKIIKHSDILNAGVSYSEFYNWADYVIKHKDEMMLPPKISLKPFAGVFYNTMPSVIKNEEIAGVKVVTRYPERTPSLDSQILLYDLRNGNVLALMDANLITVFRTGAVAAHSIQLLAKKDFSTIGLIGLGNTVRATIKVLLTLYPKKEIILKLMKYKDQHLLFANDFKVYGNLKFVFCDTYEDTVSHSDVIVSGATFLNSDICPDECFSEGCLVVPIHTMGFTNCDLFFDKVFADDTAHVSSFKYFNRFRSFSEVSEVVNGKKTGRDNDAQRILAYNIGISIHDIYFAGKFYKMCSNSEEISLNAPKDKFWV